jgi:hypothetical protein
MRLKFSRHLGDTLLNGSNHDRIIETLKKPVEEQQLDDLELLKSGQSKRKSWEGTSMTIIIFFLIYIGHFPTSLCSSERVKTILICELSEINFF